jgi:ABC-2 type transport system permease protein
MIAIILRIIKQMLNDKRSLALVIFAPILIISFMYLIFGESNYIPKINTLNVPDPIVNALEKQDIVLTHIDGDIDSIDDILLNKTSDAVLYMQDGKMMVKLYEPNSVKTTKITKTITEALASLNPNAQTLDIDFLYGSNSNNTFDSLAYVFLGVFSFFFVFLISGISFIREQTLGTMERFMLTPISKISVVLGVLIGFGIFGILQSIILVLYCKYILNIAILGSLTAVIVIMVLLSLVAITLGAVVSVFSNNEFQIVQFIPIIIVPQIFFSGLIPIDTLPYNLDKLSYAMPVFYACSGLNDVLVKGYNLTQVLPYCLALLAFTLILFVINVLLLKKYRTV